MQQNIETSQRDFSDELPQRQPPKTRQTYLKLISKKLKNKRQWIPRVGMLLSFIIIVLLVYRVYSPQALIQPKTQFRRIFWVQTDHKLEAQHIATNLVAQNLIHFAKQAEYEVRIVNNLNAYDWLSEESIAFIKETHQKSKIDLNVYELLRLALLYEHGGVSLRLPNVMMLESLDWVENLLQGKVSLEDEGVLSCKSYEGVEMVVLHQEREGGTYGFKDDFMAAKPKARLLKTLLSEIANIVKEGVWPYPDNNIVFIDSETSVVRIPNITENLITVFRSQQSDLCQIYDMQSFHQSKGTFMQTVPSNQTFTTLAFDESVFASNYQKKYLLKINMTILTDYFSYVVNTGQRSNSMLQNKLMMAKGNKWLSKPKDKLRDVQLCIVSLRPQNLQEFQREKVSQRRRLAKQTFTKWNLVNFIKDLPSVSQKTSEQVILVNASEYEGLNLQRAATKYCDPSSVILLLDHDEALSTIWDLETLASHFKSIDVFAAFLNLKTAKKVFNASHASRGSITRVTNKPNEEVLNDIGNLLRAFTVQAYRFIAPINLYHSRTGRYFDREIPLLAMLELRENFTPCEKGRIAYKLRRLEAHMAIPRQKAFTDIVISANRIRKLDLSRFEYFAKFPHLDICSTISQYNQYYQPVELMVTFNDGQEERGLIARKGTSELIPRKIHQIWMGGQVPAFNQQLMKRLRETHPNYEYFLWTEKNITQKNFPQNYGLLQKLLEFHKKSPLRKLGIISEIARLEIVYRHGGFYLDTNYMLLGENSLDQFLSYSFVTAGDRSPRRQAFMTNAFFGAVKNYPGLARIVSHRATSSTGSYPQTAGISFIGKALFPIEKQSVGVFRSSFEQLSPNFIYDEASINLNKCEAVNSTLDSQILFKSESKSYLKNCSEIYDFAFGLYLEAEKIGPRLY